MAERVNTVFRLPSVKAQCTQQAMGFLPLRHKKSNKWYSISQNHFSSAGKYFPQGRILKDFKRERLLDLALPSPFAIQPLLAQAVGLNPNSVTRYGIGRVM